MIQQVRNQEIWVNRIRYTDIDEAVKFIGLLLGKNIERGWVIKQVKEHGTIKVHGVLISILGCGPEGEVKSIPYGKDKRAAKRALLCYAPGEELIGRGICRAMR